MPTNDLWMPVAGMEVTHDHWTEHDYVNRKLMDDVLIVRDLDTILDAIIARRSQSYEGSSGCELGIGLSAANRCNLEDGLIGRIYMIRSIYASPATFRNSGPRLPKSLVILTLVNRI